MSKQRKSGKKVVLGLLALVALAVFGAWLGRGAIERNRPTTATDNKGAPSVLMEGVLYEAKAGDPAFVTARDVGSGKSLWKAELGAVSAPPLLLIDGKQVEVRVNGVRWMALDRGSGEVIEP